MFSEIWNIQKKSILNIFCLFTTAYQSDKKIIILSDIYPCIICNLQSMSCCHKLMCISNDDVTFIINSKYTSNLTKIQIRMHEYKLLAKNLVSMFVFIAIWLDQLHALISMSVLPVPVLEVHLTFGCIC